MDVPAPRKRPLFWTRRLVVVAAAATALGIGLLLSIERFFSDETCVACRSERWVDGVRLSCGPVRIPVWSAESSLPPSTGWTDTLAAWGHEHTWYRFRLLTRRGPFPGDDGWEVDPEPCKCKLHGPADVFESSPELRSQLRDLVARGECGAAEVEDALLRCPHPETCEACADDGPEDHERRERAYRKLAPIFGRFSPTARPRGGATAAEDDAAAHAEHR